MEAPGSLHLKHDPHGDAATESTHHWHGLARGALDPGGIAARTASLVLGARSDHRAESGAPGSARPDQGDGGRVGQVGHRTWADFRIVY